MTEIFITPAGDGSRARPVSIAMESGAVTIEAWDVPGVPGLVIHPVLTSRNRFGSGWVLTHASSGRCPTRDLVFTLSDDALLAARRLGQAADWTLDQETLTTQHRQAITEAVRILLTEWRDR